MNRKQSLHFHIKSDDYFGTLATVLFAQQESMGGVLSYKQVQKTLQRLTKDLVYLQQNFRIVPKPKKEKPMGE